MSNRENLIAFAKQVGLDYKYLKDFIDNLPKSTVSKDELNTAISDLENKLKGGNLAEELDSLFEIAQKINSIVNDNEVAQALTQTLNDLKARVAKLEEVDDLELLKIYTTAKGE